MDVAPGMEIAGTYRIDRLVGAGGMGLVFEATHLRVPRRVAIKVLRVAPAPELLARFKLEAEVTSRIGHPNIVSVLDCDTLPSGIPFLVMELLEGRSLASVLAHGPIPVPRAMSILRQIAAALHAAHKVGVVHRDLKPGNVFLLERELDGAVVDEVKVLDFGISKVQGATVETATNIVLGTPRYMAPEQAAGVDVSPRTDQFALGVMAYEMLSGCLPFGDGNTTSVMFKIVYEPAKPLGAVMPSLPRQVTDAIDRAMSKRPEDRFADMAELVAVMTGRPLLDRASARGIGPQPAASLVPTVPQRAQPTTQRMDGAPPGRDRHRGLAVVGLVAISVAAATVVVFALRRSGGAAIAIAPNADAAKPSPETSLTFADVDRVLGRAEQDVETGRIAEAEAAANGVLAQKPAAPRAHAILVLTACHRRDARAAREHLDWLSPRRRRELREQCDELGTRLDE